MRKDCLILVLSLLCHVAFVTAKSGDDHWVWRTYSRRERAFRDKDIDRSGSLQNSFDNKLRREPTTRRPQPGEPENDEIEDYVDADPTVTSSPNVGTRQFNPYPNNFPGQPGGQFPGQGGFGGGNPGVLVGPGGPTGIIGRQPYPYPSPYQPGIGGFGGGQNGLGFGGYPGVYGGTGLGGTGLGGNGLGGTGLGGNGLGGTGLGGGSAYPGVGGSFGGFPGGQPGAGLGLGQFPGSASQYPFGSYQGAGNNFNSNQFAAPGGQYPGLGQYPSNQYGGPQYTEGYGLAGLGSGQPGFGQPGLGPTGFGGNFGPGGNFGGGGFGYDEKSPTVVEGKSAKSVSITPASVNDKIHKN